VPGSASNPSGSGGSKEASKPGGKAGSLEDAGGANPEGNGGSLESEEGANPAGRGGSDAGIAGSNPEGKGGSSEKLVLNTLVSINRKTSVCTRLPVKPFLTGSSLKCNFDTAFQRKKAWITPDIGGEISA